MTYHVATRRALLSRPKATASANWWEAAGTGLALAVFQAKGAASYAASLLDLTGNGYELEENAGGLSTPSWAAATGWTFNPGTTNYLITTTALPWFPDTGQYRWIYVKWANCNAGTYSDYHVVEGSGTSQMSVARNKATEIFVAFRSSATLTVTSAAAASIMSKWGEDIINQGADTDVATTGSPVKNNTLPLQVGKGYAEIQAVAMFVHTMTFSQALTIAQAAETALA